MIKLLAFHCHTSFGLTMHRLAEALEEIRRVGAILKVVP
jgi:hypothetical protein